MTAVTGTMKLLLFVSFSFLTTILILDGISLKQATDDLSDGTKTNNNVGAVMALSGFLFFGAAAMVWWCLLFHRVVSGQAMQSRVTSDGNIPV
jgi:hypothetical protein